jgi:molybdopterin-containing oxidoreductase family iron-sulfur binding subunit
MANDPNYWRSLRELYDEKSVSEVKANEFMNGVTDEFNVGDLSTMSRKQFLALLSASAAFAAAGCNNYRDKGEIVPYAKKPEEVTPGVANYYASTCTACAQACGILIKTREGRPIKIDGNPDHPINQGKVCAKGQASILNLYDPYRLRKPQFGYRTGRFGDLTWKTADEMTIRRLEEAAKTGKEIAILTGTITSPTTKSVLADFKAKYPTAKVYSHSLFNDEARRRAWEKSYGTSAVPAIDWKKAKIILALESDFLGTDGSVLEQIREFANGRDIMKSNAFNRLYCVEGSMSLTGANADYRLSLRPDAQLEFVLALAREFGSDKVSGGLTLKEFASKHGLAPEILAHLVKDLKAHRGEAIIHAGNILPENVHQVVNHLNELLGNTELYSNQTSVAHSTNANPAELESLVAKMKDGNTSVVIHFGLNPVYHFPKHLDYEGALKSLPFSIALGENDDETSRLCTLVLPVNHAFESWGDHTIRTGVLSLQQPVIGPLFDSRQKEGVLLAWMSPATPYSESAYHQYLMSRWEKEVYPELSLKVDFKAFWYSALHDGVVSHDVKSSRAPRYQGDSIAGLSAIATSGFVVALTESYYLGDGAFANNGWLQELPHPVSKVVWDNYAAVSPKTAKALGVENNDLVEVKVGKAAVKLPVVLQPGQADQFISVSLGYGRTNAGPIGTDVGVDVGVLMSGDSTRLLSGGSVVKIAGRYEVVSTQEHHSLDEEFVKDLHIKRQIIREGTVEEYARNPHFLHEEQKELFNIAPGVEYNGVKWAMAIDMNKCVACNACVAGCNVENNIPVVGKEQVANGREMQWIRIDRYYSGTDESPTLSHQPMLCQHCDNAPCENVCPVAATNHSPDGLNQMVYNRCVGTKYCSNNCPYKVRRFNFFNWRGTLAEGYYDQQPLTLVHNPEVTVRSRGVMEKCTFCIQRIMESRQHATEQGRPLNGNDVKTACQDACPATAIVFGDMNDPKSAIAQYRKHELGYGVLEELNVRPNVTYVARLRNTEKTSVTP